MIWPHRCVFANAVFLCHVPYIYPCARYKYGERTLCSSYRGLTSTGVGIQQIGHMSRHNRHASRVTCTSLRLWMTGEHITRWFCESHVVLLLYHCQRLPCCRILLNPLKSPTRRVLSGGRHFKLLPQNRGYTSGNSTPGRSSHWKTGLKITGGLILNALVVYYFIQWVVYTIRIHIYPTEA